MSVFKFNKVRGIAALGLVLASVVSPVMALAPTQNYCYVMAGGAGWSFNAVDNFDIDKDNIPDSSFVWYSRDLFVKGNLDGARSIYDASAKKTTLFGASTNTQYPVAVKIEVNGNGGRYGHGTATLWMAKDSNKNGSIDANEPLLARGAVIQLVDNMQSFK